MLETEFKFSIVCPALNEEMYIEKMLQAFSQHCPKPSQLFIADGGSIDRTRDIVKEWSAKNDHIYLVENMQRYVSFAFNTCFPRTKGKYVALLGAHTDYPKDFFTTAWSELEAGNADVVGGPLRQVGKPGWGEAIAYCMSTAFGVGGTEFRVSRERSFVDSVAFAFYKREIFEQIGLFDTCLIRNQDDEMHYRMNAAGYKILMVPEMECEYYVRSDLRALMVQYFGYGLYKPLVIKKVSSGFRIRHLVPALFCLYLFLLPAIIIVKFFILVAPFALYVALLLKFSFANQLTWGSKIRALFVYPILHISYGSGFLIGILRLRLLDKANE